MRFIPTIVAGALALTFVSASSASAVGTTINTTCAALAASTRTISFSDGELDISFTSGDIVSWTNHVNPGLVVTSVNGVYLTPFVSTGSYTLGATDTSFMILAHPNGPYTSPTSIDVSCVQASSAGHTPEQTQEQIAGYMQNRASQTIAIQPDLIGLLSGASTGNFNADVTQSNGNFDFATSGDQPVWAKLQGSWSEFGAAESSYFFGAVGAHMQVSPDALVGIMLEFDKLTQTDGASSTEGDGYLVGPYFVAKLPNQPLFIEGRLLTGKTENQVSVNGAATETFDTQRTFASMKVAGQLNYGELALTPSVTATHLRDAQDAFVDTLGNTIGAQGIEVNSVAAGLNFAQPVYLSNGELILNGGISGIWSSSKGTGLASSVAPTTDGLRAQITFGATHTRPNGVTFNAQTFYDGIGQSNYESYGLSLGAEMQF